MLFLLGFQRTVERLMALRTTTYTALTLEGIAAGADFRPADREVGPAENTVDAVTFFAALAEYACDPNVVTVEKRLGGWWLNVNHEGAAPVSAVLGRQLPGADLGARKTRLGQRAGVRGLDGLHGVGISSLNPFVTAGEGARLRRGKE